MLGLRRCCAVRPATAPRFRMRPPERSVSQLLPDGDVNEVRNWQVPYPEFVSQYRDSPPPDLADSLTNSELVQRFASLSARLVHQRRHPLHLGEFDNLIQGKVMCIEVFRSIRLVSKSIMYSYQWRIVFSTLLVWRMLKNVTF